MSNAVHPEHRHEETELVGGDTVKKKHVRSKAPRFRWVSRDSLRFGLVLALALVLGLAVRPYAFSVAPIADDYAQFGMLKGQYPSPRSAFDLFNFADGTAADLARLTHSGFFPWWSHPELRLSMWRPLSSALMWFDLYVLGENWQLHHAHSAVWWIALVCATATLWRMCLPLSVLALTLPLFVVDEAHGVLLAWLANRNAITSSFFAVLALTIYTKVREGQLRQGLGWAATSWTLALGFGEYALTFFGYFVAYESLRGNGRLVRRLRYLGVVLLPVGAFLISRAWLGYGPRHSGIYVDPSIEPIKFFSALAQRLPVLVGDLVVALRSDFWTFGFPWTDWLIREHAVSREWATSLLPWRRVHVLIGIGALALFAAIAASVLRRRTRGDHLWWLTIGAILSIVPASAPFPSSRLVTAALIGICPLLVTFIQQNVRHRYYWIASVALLAVHATLPPWQTYTETRNLSIAAEAVRHAVLNMQVDHDRLPKQRVVVLNAVDASLGFYIPLIRFEQGVSVPERCWVLSGSPTPLSILRTAPNALEVAIVSGQSATGSSYEQMFRSFSDPLQVGDMFDLDGMRVEVLAVREGGFVSALFTFDRSLDDPNLLFVHAGPYGIQPVRMPPVGKTALVASPTYAPFMEQ